MAQDALFGPSDAQGVPRPDIGILDDRRVIRPEEPANERLEKVWNDPPGVLGWFRALQNDALGGRMIVLSFVFFLVAGIMALLMRIQLIRPENNFVGADTFNELFTMHGSTMMFLFAVPMLEGFAIFLLPFLLGNREMPFPRLGQFSFFTFLLGGMLFFSSYLFDAVPDAGWFAYVPLSGPRFSPDLALDFWLLGLGVAEVAAIAAGVEIIIAILRMRGPGMTMGRMPVISWAYLVTAFAILFAFTTLLVATLMLELDRKFGTQFFEPLAGGSPLLWQHLFWIFGHPEVYIQLLPATGMVSMIVPVFVRRPLLGYRYIVLAIVATGFASFVLWAHHMFTAGMPQAAMTLFSVASIMIAIPAGIQIFAWLATIFYGKPVWRTAFLFVIGFIITFVMGGITGVMVGSIPLDYQVHDSYFVVAHFHYVLIGGVTFPLFAAFYYWMPFFTGRHMDERLGKWNFWLFFIGFHVTFFPMHMAGLLGMPRRVYTYPMGMGLDIHNLISTLGSFLLAIAITLFLFNFVKSMTRGERAGTNPWKADSLEWATGSPPPSYGFAHLPIIHSRHPLWEQASLRPEEAPVQKMLEDMSGWPLTWRAALTTSVLEARPTEVFRVSGPSIFPFLTSVGAITIFAAEIFTTRWLVLTGVLLVVAGLVGWHWPNRIETTERELAFERRHGIPVYPNGSPTIDRWGMLLFLLLIAIVVSLFAFAYFFLRLQNDTWPMDNIGMPGLLLPALGTLAMLLAAGAMFDAQRSARTSTGIRMRLGLLAAFLLGGVAVATVILDLRSVPFDHSVNVYGSIYWAMSILMAVIVVGAMGQNLFTQVGAWVGNYSPREHVAVNVGALLWYGALLFWVVLAAVLYLAPHVI